MTTSHRSKLIIALAFVLVPACVTPDDETETTSSELEACVVEDEVSAKRTVDQAIDAVEIDCESAEDPLACSTCDPGPMPAYDEDDDFEDESAAGLDASLAEASLGFGRAPFPKNVQQCITDAWKENPLKLSKPRLSISACGWVQDDVNLAARAGALALCSVIQVGGCAGLDLLCQSLKPGPKPCLTTADHPYSICVAAHIRYCSG